MWVFVIIDEMGVVKWGGRSRDRFYFRAAFRVTERLNFPCRGNSPAVTFSVNLSRER